MPDQRKQLPLRHAETAAAFILIVQAVGGLAALLVASYSKSQAAIAGAWHIAAGLLIWLACLIHQRLRRMALEEELDTETLRESSADRGRLFEEQEANLLSARRRVEQFEKYFLPFFSVLVCLALGYLCYWFLRRVLTTPEPDIVLNPAMTAVIFGFAALISFLFSRYSAGLAVEPAWRPVRPGAHYSMSCAIVSLLVTLALAATHFRVAWAEPIVAHAVPILMGILALETFLFIIWGIYRPRVAGVEWRPAHDSRLLGAVTTSGGILRATADTLDYQFGFKVSETWFYRFMERAIAPLILFQALTLYLLTCFVVVGPDEQGIIEFLGQPRDMRDAKGNRTALGPGLHLKWPWPVEIAYTHPIHRIHTLTIGEQLHEDVRGYTWSVSHAKEPFSVIVANRPGEKREPKKGGEEGAAPDVADAAGPRRAPPVSLLTGTVIIYYRANNIYDYHYNHLDTEKALRAVCNRALIRYAAQEDFLELLSHKRGEAVAALKAEIDRIATERSLGVEVTQVLLQGLHPPVEVGPAFEEEIAALEKKEALIWEAQADHDRLIPKAEAQKWKDIQEAEAYKERLKKIAEARAERFAHQLNAYDKAPEVFVHRKRLAAMVAALADRRKIIMPAWADIDTVILNFDLKDVMSLGTEGGLGEVIATEERDEE